MRGLYVLPGAEPEEVHIQHEGGTIPFTAKTMRQLTCTDRPYKANHKISEYLYCSTYCAPSVWHKVPYAVAILVFYKGSPG